MRARPATGLPENTLQKELARFKRVVRFIVARSDNDQAKVAFAPGSRNPRLKGMRITGHQAAIRATPCLTDEEWIVCTHAISKQTARCKNSHAKIC